MLIFHQGKEKKKKQILQLKLHPANHLKACSFQLPGASLHSII